MSKLAKELLGGTITNYALLVARIACAVFMTRILFLGLGESNYGFWSLLWAVFGYSVFLDFGFGQAIQKFTAETDVKDGIHVFNKIISTVMSMFCAFSFVIVIASLVIAYYLDRIFNLGTDSAENIRYLKISFAVFGIGVAAVFPTGIFPEILTGIRRFDIRNAILTVNVLLNLAGIYLLISNGYSLLAIAVFSSVLNLLTNLVMITVIIKLLPGFRISPFLFDMKKLKEVSSFSVYSYICTVADMFITRVDRIIIGICLGMGSVGIYQVGTRLPEMMEKLTTQFQATLGPMAASLYKSGDFEKLRWILLRSAKISAFITGFFFVVFYMLSLQILKIWLKVDDSIAVSVTSVMLVSIFVGVAFRSTQGKFLLMAGGHRKQALINVAYAALNIALIAAVVKPYGVLGTAYACMISNIIVSVFVVFPLSAKSAKMRISYFLRKVYLPLLIPIALSAASLTVFQHLFKDWTLFRLALAATVSLVLYLAAGALFYFERDDIRKLVDASGAGRILSRLKARE